MFRLSSPFSNSHTYSFSRWLSHSLLLPAAGALMAMAAPFPAHAAPSRTFLPMVPQYGKFETAFSLPDAQGNPFDPVENDVWATFTGPGGAVRRIPAFWDGEAGWKVRFSPTTPGEYHLILQRNGRDETPGGMVTDFRCIPSNRRGFIRRDQRHVQQFRFDNGQVYYPLGCDQAWRSGNLPGYPEMFSQMSLEGMNWARIWMTFWDGKALDWAPRRQNSPPPGQLLLGAARTWDSILDAADDAGIYIQMTLQHHGQFTRVVDPNWADNPLNAANPGGFLKEPQDFFTDPRALALTRAKYRYIIARYSYSNHIMGWELFNEVQNNPELNAHYADVLAWHKEMAAYLRSLDPNHHLVTTSYSDCGDPIEKAADLDYDQPHAYVPDIVSLFASRQTTDCAKPIFYGEWGSAGGQQTAAFLHQGLWSGIMAPMAGAPQFWYWDTLEPNNLWPEYGAVSRYLAASRLPEFPDAAPAHPRIRSSERGDVSFAPTRGWEPTTTYEVTISPDDGAAQGISGVSSFLQGSGHRDMVRQPIVFHVDYPQAGQFQLTVGRVARSGAHPQILLDARVAAEKSYPAADQDTTVSDTLTVNVPAGRHQVALFNPGPDWVVISSIRLTGYAPALACVAKSTAQAVFFWVYARPGTGGASHPISGSLTFSGLQDGNYTLELWNTTTGAPEGRGQTIHVRRGRADVKIDSLTGDAAGWIAP